MRARLRRWSAVDEKKLCRFYSYEMHGASFVVPSEARRVAKEVERRYFRLVTSTHDPITSSWPARIFALAYLSFSHLAKSSRQVAPWAAQFGVVR